VILAGLALVSAVIFFLDAGRRALEEGPHVVVLAAEARGLQRGTDVWVAGKPAGRVKDIHFGDPTGPENRRVIIVAVLHRSAARFLRETARARIGSSALLAPVVLKLDPGAPEGARFDFADTLYAPRDTIRETLFSLWESGRAEARALAKAVGDLGRRTRDGPGTVARFRQDTTFLVRLPGAVARMRGLSQEFRRRDGLGSLLADDSLRASARRAVLRLSSLATDERSRALRDTIADLAASLQRVSHGLAAVEAGLAAGRGTAGRVAHDTELTDQAHMLRTGLDSATAELMLHPFRWLRFRIF
jgi:hypothetical protein